MARPSKSSPWQSRVHEGQVTPCGPREEIAAIIEILEDLLSWDDFFEIEPGMWAPRPGTERKILSLKQEMIDRSKRLDDERAALQAKIETMWFNARLLNGLEQYVKKPDPDVPFMWASVDDPDAQPESPV